MDEETGDSRKNQAEMLQDNEKIGDSRDNQTKMPLTPDSKEKTLALRKSSPKRRLKDEPLSSGNSPKIACFKNIPEEIKHSSSSAHYIFDSSTVKPDNFAFGIPISGSQTLPSETIKRTKTSIESKDFLFARENYSVKELVDSVSSTDSIKKLPGDSEAASLIYSKTSLPEINEPKCKEVPLTTEELKTPAFPKKVSLKKYQEVPTEETFSRNIITTDERCHTTEGNKITKPSKQSIHRICKTSYPSKITPSEECLLLPTEIKSEKKPDFENFMSSLIETMIKGDSKETLKAVSKTSAKQHLKHSNKTSFGVPQQTIQQNPEIEIVDLLKKCSSREESQEKVSTVSNENILEYSAGPSGSTHVDINSPASSSSGIVPVISRKMTKGSEDSSEFSKPEPSSYYPSHVSLGGNLRCLDAETSKKLQSEDFENELKTQFHGLRVPEDGREIDEQKNLSFCVVGEELINVPKQNIHPPLPGLNSLPATDVKPLHSSGKISLDDFNNVSLSDHKNYGRLSKFSKPRSRRYHKVEPPYVKSQPTAMKSFTTNFRKLNQSPSKSDNHSSLGEPDSEMKDSANYFKSKTKNVSPATNISPSSSVFRKTPESIEQPSSSSLSESMIFNDLFLINQPDRSLTPEIYRSAAGHDFTTSDLFLPGKLDSSSSKKLSTEIESQTHATQAGEPVPTEFSREEPIKSQNANYNTLNPNHISIIKDSTYVINRAHYELHNLSLYCNTLSSMPKPTVKNIPKFLREICPLITMIQSNFPQAVESVKNCISNILERIRQSLNLQNEDLDSMANQISDCITEYSDFTVILYEIRRYWLNSSYLKNLYIELRYNISTFLRTLYTVFRTIKNLRRKLSA